MIAALSVRPCPLRLTGAVQPYGWGGSEFIPRLVGRQPEPRQPAAELWLGAHPVAPATAWLEGLSAPLDGLLRRAPHLVLGRPTAARFGDDLPYLLKVLDVGGMLSIQAHPTRAQAEEGFAREDREGVPRTAPHRSYRDTNHKPEMQVALTPFWMLYGFKNGDDLGRALDGVPELHALASLWRDLRRADERSAHRRLYEHVMTAPQDEVDRWLAPLVSRLAPRYRAHDLDRFGADFWAARAAGQFPLPEGHFDRGLVSIYLLNLVRLQPGEGTFIGAGVLHAYLEGAAIEVMANSDNVLRGGLTPKHVDVAELLRILRFEATIPALLATDVVSSTETVFRAPVDAFGLSRVRVDADHPHFVGPVVGADTLLCMEGRARLRAGVEDLALERGTVVLVPNGIAYSLVTADEAVVFKASVPSADQ